MTGRPVDKESDMMTCGNCHTNLDDVPVGRPCPSCGAGRRDAMATPQTVAAVVQIGQPLELDISNSVLAIKSDTLALKPVVKTRTFTTTISADDGDAQLIAETREGDDVIGFAVGPPDDVLLDSASDIRDRLDDA